ncbi:MAG: glycosyl hydrolase [Deltaproteobacteria bacterium]|nr:glycosyl hydrolase [Deltaproteobacteria bacterium]
MRRAWSIVGLPLLLLTACPTANPRTKADASGIEGDGTTHDAEIFADAQLGDGGGADATTPGDAAPDGGDGGGGDAGPSGACRVEVRYQPAAARDVFVAGSWDGFNPTATRMTDPEGDGMYTAMLDLAPGLYGYKLVVDGTWNLDPSHRYRAYFGGVENSGLRVSDCRAPRLELVRKEGQLSGSGRGDARFVLHYTPGDGDTGPDPDGFELSLRTATGTRAIAAGERSWNAAAQELTVSLTGLTDGKHTVTARARSLSGRASSEVVLPFWVELESFDWRDAILYMIVTDRFRDGDPANNPPPTPGAVPSADFMGGDLRGVTQSIREGYFDDLQVKALWLTPFNVNPAGVNDDGDGVHRVTGYHGYWPIDPRRVDDRLGGDPALRELTQVAHQHGIRVLMDFVINHVHEQHPYVAQHPDWFHTLPNGCICGTAGCDWTARRLDCLFKPYMPDIDWENNVTSEAFIADALWWLEHFDLDGVRVDAVKHVPDGAIFNLSIQIEERLERAGTNYFTVGETAMGWYNCNPADPACNAENYGTIARYVGPQALDGQFDFVLHHGTALSVFAYDNFGMIHADVWTRASQERYPAGAIMTPYVGSHDEARFVTHVTNSSLTGNKWPDQQLPPAPQGDLAYQRLALAQTWNLTIPGAPLLYYGDEYGEYGASDPDNRHMMRFDTARSASERAQFQRTRAIARARWELPALRRGDLTTLATTETFWAYLRSSAGQGAIVAINRSPAATTQTVTVPGTITLPSGTVLRDRLGGPSITLAAANSVTISLGAYSAAILAP